MVKNILYFLLLVTLAWMVNRCASQGYPEGGPRDETPPHMVSSTPAADSRNFKGSLIDIEFDELIQLNEVLQKVVISPPVEKTPSITARGRMVRIKFEGELQPATTYTIDFADAIRDNNENNPLSNFTFSFSTGESRDSLQIAGNLYEAETLTPVKGALVMAHVNHNDSAFTNMVPPRVAKTDEMGRFVIKNLSNQVYRVFALEDMNRNYRFDQPGERIAWDPQLVEPSFEYRQRLDSVFTDSLTLDTVLVTRELVYLPDSLQLFLFQEDYKEQYLTSRERNVRNRLDFIFNRPLKNLPEISIINAKPALNKWYIYQLSANRDTVAVWLTDTTLIAKDTLTVKFGYQMKDSLKNLVLKTDTIKLFYFEQAGRKKRRKDDEKEQVEPLIVTGPQKSLEIGADPRLEFPVPLASADISSAKLYQLVDTVYNSVDFNWVQDSINIRSFKVVHPWQPEEKYRLLIDSAAFTGIYGLVNKPLKYDFDIKAEKNYAILYVHVLQADPTMLLQVLNRQEIPVKQGYVPANGKIAFRYIKPGDYFLRIVDDVNKNGKWDTGNFEEGRQPESVSYYPDAISLRANWDQLVTWDIPAHPVYEFVEKNRIKKSGQRSNTQRR